MSTYETIVSSLRSFSSDAIFPHFLKTMVKWMAIVRFFHFVKFCYPFPIFPRARRRWSNFGSQMNVFHFCCLRFRLHPATPPPCPHQTEWAPGRSLACLCSGPMLKTGIVVHLRLSLFQYTSGLSSYMSLSPPATHWVSLHFSFVASAQSQQLLTASHIFWSLALHLFFSFL